MPPGRRALFQYALFAGFNDSPHDADLLADYVRPVHCRVNVIAGNPGPDPSLRAPEPTTVEAFAERLRAGGITTIIRRARGRDVGAACGQLAGAHRHRQEVQPCP
jgi:23S rRNA (adenine2503-C2)-methyltransferase